MANKIVVIKTPGPRGPQGPAGANGPISSSGQFTSADDVTFGTGSFSSISSNYITASLIDVDADTIRIGGTPFSKTDLDTLREGKSIATGSKGGFSSFIEGSAFISSIDENVLIRTGNDRLSFNNGSGYILDLFRSRITLSGSVDVTGSLKVLGNSPAIISDGDVFIGGNDDGLGGIIYYNPTTETPEQAGAARIHNYDNGNNHYTNIGQDTIVSASYGVAQGYATIAHQYAHSEGSASVASGNYSHAEGGGTLASGVNSHAEGANTTASGANSHAEGSSGVVASGFGSHAEGYNTEAAGQNSHAEGANTLASGNWSHAEGGACASIGSFSHAEGKSTLASGSYQHAQGQFNTHGNTSSLMIIGNGATFDSRSDLALFNMDGIEFTEPLSGSIISASGQLYAGLPTSSDGSGSIVVINPNTGEFTYTSSFTTIDTGSFYNSSSISGNSLIFFQGDGTNDLITLPTTTVDTGSFVTTGSVTSNVLTFTQGDGTTFSLTVNTGSGGGADDDWGISSDDNWVTSSRGVEITGSLINGNAATAVGIYSHAEGLGTTANGSYSHAEGRNTTADGSAAHAEGFGALASGNYAHAEGRNTTASANYAHSEGNGTLASGESSHAEGSGSTASGLGAHAQGFETLASGIFSATFGYRTTASGDYSIAVGQGSKAEGSFAYAAGNSSTAAGRSSRADGNSVSTHISASYSLVKGEDSEAVGIASVALGTGSRAGHYFDNGGGDITHSGHFSLISGDHVTSSRDYQTVLGSYNEESDSAIFLVGTGIDESQRLNAIHITSNPTIIDLSGSLKVSGSVSIDIGSLPTSDPGVGGQLYTTGSDFLGGPAGKKVLMIS